MFNDELGQGFFALAGGRLPVSDYSPTGGSSFFFDFSNYLGNLFNPKASDELSRDYCDKMGTAKAETCKKLVARSLTQAVNRLRNQQGNDMSQWFTPAENLVFQNLGAGSVEPIPWQNRGTHNHVVEVLADAP